MTIAIDKNLLVKACNACSDDKVKEELKRILFQADMQYSDYHRIVHHHESLTSTLI